LKIELFWFVTLYGFVGGNMLNPYSGLKYVGFRDMFNYMGELQGVWTCDPRIGSIETYHSILDAGRVHY
jgi:hypothetical protein